MPDPQDPATFERSKLNWSEIDSGAHADMLSFYKTLIKLRREEPALTDGRMTDVETSYDEVKRWFVMSRGPIDVVCNFSNSSQAVPTKAGNINLGPQSVKVNKRS